MHLHDSLLDDPPERANRIRSQVLERFHNKLSEGEQSILQRRHSIKLAIQQSIKEVEREYQKQKKEIDRQFYRQTKALKEELMEVDDNE